ncbi:hypothetical protein [Celeribacter halophilus]
MLCELLRTLDELTFLRVLFPKSGQTMNLAREILATMGPNMATKE